MRFNFFIAALVVLAVVLAMIVANSINTVLLDQSRPSVQVIQPIHVDVDLQILALSVLLAAADHYNDSMNTTTPSHSTFTCEEDEYYWFTGDFDGVQWVRKCVPVDVLFVQ